MLQKIPNPFEEATQLRIVNVRLSFESRICKREHSLLTICQARQKQCAKKTFKNFNSISKKYLNLGDHRKIFHNGILEKSLRSNYVSDIARSYSCDGYVEMCSVPHEYASKRWTFCILFPFKRNNTFGLYVGIYTSLIMCQDKSKNERFRSCM